MGHISFYISKAGNLRAFLSGETFCPGGYPLFTYRSRSQIDTTSYNSALEISRLGSTRRLVPNFLFTTQRFIVPNVYITYGFSHTWKWIQFFTVFVITVKIWMVLVLKTSAILLVSLTSLPFHYDPGLDMGVHFVQNKISLFVTNV